MPKRIEGTAEEALKRKMEQNILHQRTFLAKDENRVLFNAKRREAYALKKQQLLQSLGIATPEPTPAPTQRGRRQQTQADDESSDDEEEVQSFKYNKVNRTLDLSKVKSLSLETCLACLDILEEKTGVSTKGHKTSMRRVVKITNCDDILECINKHSAKIIDEIIAGQKVNKSKGTVTTFAINTLKVTWDSICFVIERLLLPVPRAILQKFKDKSASYQAKSGAQQTERQKTERIPRFETYHDKILEVFGEDSEMDLITRLYEETHGARDNFGLVIISDMAMAKPDLGGNYILAKRQKKGKKIIILPLRVIIDNFKTKNDYEGYDLNLSNDLSKRLRAYITKNKRKDGDYLFGVEKLSPFINKSNTELRENHNFLKEAPGGVNLFRKMLASDVEFDKLSTDEQQEEAKRFKHTITTHKQYLRLHIDENTSEN
jgi:hypothetical protein